MRVRNLLLAAGVALGAASAANAQVYSAGGLPLSINDNTTFTSVLNVPDSFNITDINLIFKATHTWRSDIDFALIRNGSYIVLGTDIDGSSDNYDVRFDQSAADSITTYTGSGGGTFSPEGSTGTFATQGFSAHAATAFGSLGILETNAVSTLDFWNGTSSSGDWTLLVSDDATGDPGELTYWSIEFNGAVDPNGPAAPPPPAPPFSGNFAATPNVLSHGVAAIGTTIWDENNPQPGLTDGAGEAAAGTNYTGIGFDYIGNEVAYRIEHAGGDLQLNLTGLSTDLDMILLDSSGLPANAIAGSEAFGGAADESILLAGAAPGTYYAIVETWGPGNDGSAFVLTYLPAPGALALMGLGGLVAGRRRR